MVSLPAYDHHSYSYKPLQQPTYTTPATTATTAVAITLCEVVVFIVLVGSAFVTVGGTQDTSYLWSILGFGVPVKLHFY
jgi:hypothetical protein